jgi:Rv0078B-related antitoxin
VADESAAERLRLALDMYEFGERMQRSRIMRERPDAAEPEITSAIQEWLLDRPGAPFGDAVGRTSDRFA